MSVTIRRARDEREVAAAIALRTTVFVDEQGVPPHEELDGHDDEALHLVAVDAGGVVVGTCRLLTGEPAARLGRMAVARPARRGGIGGGLLELAETEARATAAENIVLGAQVAALALYERAGYVPRGDVFLDAGIEHVWMEKRLA